MTLLISYSWATEKWWRSYLFLYKYSDNLYALTQHKVSITFCILVNVDVLIIVATCGIQNLECQWADHLSRIDNLSCF